MTFIRCGTISKKEVIAENMKVDIVSQINGNPGSRDYVCDNNCKAVCISGVAAHISGEQESSNTVNNLNVTVLSGKMVKQTKNNAGSASNYYPLVANYGCVVAKNGDTPISVRLNTGFGLWTHGVYYIFQIF